MRLSLSLSNATNRKSGKGQDVNEQRKPALPYRIKEFFGEEKNCRRTYSGPELCHRFGTVQSSLNRVLVNLRREGWQIEDYNEFGVKYYRFQNQKREQVSC
jgi:hypothetical protein